MKHSTFKGRNGKAIFPLSALPSFHLPSLSSVRDGNSSSKSLKQWLRFRSGKLCTHCLQRMWALALHSAGSSLLQHHPTAGGQFGYLWRQERTRKGRRSTCQQSSIFWRDRPSRRGVAPFSLSSGPAQSISCSRSRCNQHIGTWVLGISERGIAWAHLRVRTQSKTQTAPELFRELCITQTLSCLASRLLILSMKKGIRLSEHMSSHSTVVSLCFRNNPRRGQVPGSTSSKSTPPGRGCASRTITARNVILV